MTLHMPSNSSKNASAAAQALPIEHSENFPVASWLCPPHLRPAIAAIYAFARAADDIADEGDWSPSDRLAQLSAFKNELLQNDSAAGLRPDIFKPLHAVVAKYELPTNLLSDLLSAFEQDVAASANGSTYLNLSELLNYCQRSANPVGRLLLHLYGVSDPLALERSDAICSALQLINFWQDLSEDIPRGRLYLPQDLKASMSLPALMDLLCQHAHQLMMSGAPLVHQVPGRAGWELRLVVQGGLRVLEKVERLGTHVFQTRPRLRAWDFPLMAWRSFWM